MPKVEYLRWDNEFMVFDGLDTVKEAIRDLAMDQVDPERREKEIEQLDRADRSRVEGVKRSGEFLSGPAIIAFGSTLNRAQAREEGISEQRLAEILDDIKDDEEHGALRYWELKSREPYDGGLSNVLLAVGRFNEGWNEKLLRPEFRGRYWLRVKPAGVGRQLFVHLQRKYLEGPYAKTDPGEQ